MLKLVRDKYEISASFVRDKCVTNGVGYYPEATSSLSWHGFCSFAHELKNEMRMKRIFFLFAFMALTFGTQAADVQIDAERCVVIKDGKEFPLYGKVKIVDSFEDIKVKIVDCFEDVDIKIVDCFEDRCGKVKLVDSFEDVKVKIVDSFEDIKVKIVQNFEGVKR